MATTVKAPPVRNTKGEPPPQNRPSQNLTKPNPEKVAHLNFRVPAGFHQEFKTYAASHGVSMVDLLEHAFRHYNESTK